MNDMYKLMKDMGLFLVMYLLGYGCKFEYESNNDIKNRNDEIIII